MSLESADDHRLRSPAMSLEHLAGTTYGPVSLVIPSVKVREFVDATGDDAHRWTDLAPPAYAGALLFVIAPDFLHADGVRGNALVHTDQQFRWSAELPVGESVTVQGGIERVRSRGDTSLVTLNMAVTDASGTTLLEGASGFLVAAGAVGSPAAERAEPPVADAGPNEVPGRVEFAGPGPLPSLAKSASRADLVRYAGASGDLNPIHWDHDSARAAGLAGTVVHGLLTMAWASQLAVSASRRPDPLEEMSFRFKQPVLPGEAATVTGDVEADENSTATLRLALRVGSDSRAGGTATIRR
jgi:acyl dehydratase